MGSVYFEKDKYDLTEETKMTLNSMAGDMKNHRLRDVLLSGNTDDDADSVYNQELALNRVREVRKYLSDLGVQNRFHLVSFGEDKPINNNSDESLKSKNRRVDISYFDNRSDFSEQFEAESEIFRINPFEDNEITTARGTKISIPKNAFDPTKPHHTVKIHIKEFFRKADFLTQNLTTLTSDNRLLESNGMFNIQAIQDEDTLALEDGKSIKILFPERNVVDNYQLFSGQHGDPGMMWDQETFTSTRSYTSQSWGRTWVQTTPKKADTLEKWKSWYEAFDGETYEITHRIDLKENKETFDTISVKNEQLMDQLVQSSTKMGWINCDRFIDDKSPKGSFIVQVPSTEVPSVSIAFEGENVIMPFTYRENDRYYFQNIPLNRKVDVVAIAQNDSDELSFALMKSYTGAKTPPTLSFEILEAEVIQQRLASLE